MSKEENKPKCEDCKYYDGSTKESQCRYRPPTVLVQPVPGGGTVINSAWPMVNPDSWCGQFEGK